MFAIAPIGRIFVTADGGLGEGLRDHAPTETTVVTLSYRVRHDKAGVFESRVNTDPEKPRKRREWSDVKPDVELDHRHTRELKAKHYKFNISMPPGLFMQMEAARRKLDFGNGMSRSRFIAYCIGRYFHKKSQEWFESEE